MFVDDRLFCVDAWRRGGDKVFATLKGVVLGAAALPLLTPGIGIDADREPDVEPDPEVELDLALDPEPAFNCTTLVNRSPSISLPTGLVSLRGGTRPAEDEEDTGIPELDLSVGEVVMNCMCSLAGDEGGDMKCVGGDVDVGIGEL